MSAPRANSEHSHGATRDQEPCRGRTGLAPQAVCLGPLLARLRPLVMDLFAIWTPAGVPAMYRLCPSGQRPLQSTSTDLPLSTASSEGQEEGTRVAFGSLVSYLVGFGRS